MSQWLVIFALAAGLLEAGGSANAMLLLSRGQSIALLTQVLRVDKTEELFLDLPLVFLPRAGCLGIAVQIQDRSYIAVVDTGSPFLTAPPDLLDATTDGSSVYPTTTEQYGEGIGGMQWREAHSVGVGGATLRTAKLFLGVVSDSIVEASGGLYLGLLYADDNRPTFLHQCQFNAFAIDYADRKLRLFYEGRRGGDIFSFDGVTRPWPMVDLTPFGPNVYHYGVFCDSVLFQVESSRGRARSIRLSKTKRPVVVVFDTGLTGCILSDSFREELGDISLETITGASIQLEPYGTVLVSDPQYWYLSSFRLPWFPDDSNHPHILAAGGTFLNNSRLLVDARRRLMYLQPKAP